MQADKVNNGNRKWAIVISLIFTVTVCFYDGQRHSQWIRTTLPRNLHSRSYDDDGGLAVLAALFAGSGSFPSADSAFYKHVA